MADFIVAGAVVLAAGAAVYGFIQRRKQGGACSGCPSAGSCHGCTREAKFSRISGKTEDAGKMEDQK